MTLQISVIIPFHRRMRYIDLTLRKLKEQTCQQDCITEVLVLDSHSCERELVELVPIFTEAPNFLVKIVHTDNNLSRKRNVGISNSNSDLLIFLDDDCIPAENFLKFHIDASMNEAHAFCGLVKFDVTKNKGNFYRFRSDLESVNDDVYSINKPLTASRARAMNFSISRKLLMKNELYFDENFQGYGWEDFVFFSHLIDKGIKVYPCNALIWHEDHTSLMNFVHKMNQFGAWFDSLSNRYPQYARKLSFNKLLNIARLCLPLTPVLFIVQSILTFTLSTTNGCRWLYSYKAYRLLYRISFAYGYINSIQADKLPSFNKKPLD